MPLIWTNTHNSEVNRIHYRPERLNEAQKKDAVVVDTIPLAEQVKGKYAVLNYTEERGLFYEYYDIPEEPEPEYQEGEYQEVQESETVEPEAE